MPHRIRPRLLTRTALFAFAVGVWLPSSFAKTTEEPMLRVAVLPAPGVFEPAINADYQEQSQHAIGGFETQLLRQLASRLGYELQFRQVASTKAALAALHNDTADIAAAHFSRSNQLSRDLTWSVPLVSSPVMMVHNASKSLAPASPLDLIGVGDLTQVPNDARHGEIMRSMQRQFPELSWQQSRSGTAAALASVANGNALFTLADQHELLLHSPRFPRLSAAFAVGSNRQIAWALRADNRSLNSAINRFIAAQHFAGNINRQYQRSFAHLERLNPSTVTTFRTEISRSLPAYRQWLIEAGGEQGYDWRLLAAMSYQESRWNPSAKSPTGVRGFMMLTRKTAYQLEVRDRTDAKESIFGGAKFLRALSDRLGTTVTEPDRTWLALAAYNIGLGHLRDTRQLTYEAGGDPNQWLDIKRQLPLLSKKPFCETLKYGCARGGEAVHYVTNIRAFYQLLRWYTPTPAAPDTRQQTQSDSASPALSDSLLSNPTN